MKSISYIITKRILTVLLIPGIMSLSVLPCYGKSFSTYQEPEFGDWTPMKGGCGGVFFYAAEGPLIIEIEKEDLNITGNPTALRALFVGPDRKVIEDKWIPEDGLPRGKGKGPRQALRYETTVERPGVYAVMITVSYDRYGEFISWRFRSTCKKFMIETSRGHRDAVHEEPIVLRDPERKAEVCFLPQKNAFNLKVTGLAKDVTKLELRDVNNNQIKILEVKNDTAMHLFEAKKRNAVPWRILFPKAQGRIEIDGVTGWKTNDKSDHFSVYPQGALWTPSASSWFPLHANRWLIQPYSRKVYGKTGEDKSAVFEIHNNGTEPTHVMLSLEFPDGIWDARLNEKTVRLKANEKKDITVSWKGMDHDRVVHLRARTEDFTTYSTIYAVSGEPAVKSQVNIPMVLKPYSHEQEQYGYLPDYPTDNQVYFDTKNGPFIATSEGIATLRENNWETTKLNSGRNSIIAFDADNHIYSIAYKNNNPVLVHSSDGGRTYASYSIPGSRRNSSFDIEQFSGHNVPQGPPPITRFTRTGADASIFWRKFGEMELLIPRKTAKGIEWEDPILISEKCLGVSSHSGIPSSMASRGSKIFLVWGEVSDPDASREDIPGVPVYVNSYDKETGILGEPVLVGFGAPPNDVHNIPAITIDSEGYLHVLTGTHGRPFHYARSLQPENVHAGWTEAAPVMTAEGSQSTQTYVGLVTGPENTLHLVFRLWRYNSHYFPDNYFASLAYMSKKKDEPWSEPQLLAVAPFSHYSIYRHRFTTDRSGRLFVSFEYWSTYWFYRNDRRNTHRTLLMSPDAGQSWKLVEKDDFLQGQFKNRD